MKKIKNKIAKSNILQKDLIHAQSNNSKILTKSKNIDKII